MCKRSIKDGAAMMRNNAFTLIETMVVLGIVTVLSLVLLNVTQKIRSEGDSAVAISQMRQIGLGVIQYASDRDGTLPGPMKPDQGAVYDPGVSNQLASALGSYLGVVDLEKKAFVGTFVPPAARRALSGVDPAIARYFVMNISASSAAGAKFKPWGSTATQDKSDPMKIQALPGRVWALCDADRLNPEVQGQSWESRTPEKIVHGSQRLALFFDGSVAPLLATELKKPGGGATGSAAPPPPPPPPPPR